MMENASHFNEVFNCCIADYQRHADIERVPENPFREATLDYALYQKSWIDNVQWDLEDLIRDPEILPGKALDLKRRIDRSNQNRTDMVEQIDDLFESRFHDTKPRPDARLNTESVAWALDRLSILLLKIHHMGIQAGREDADDAHRTRCRRKLEILEQQRLDLLQAVDELIEDVVSGRRIVKVYRQMKMYNDPSLNPIYYSKKQG